MKTTDITGKTFGKLTVIRQMPERIHKNTVWECKCECRNICYVTKGHLTSGHTKSCGCLSKRPEAKNTNDLTGKTFGKLRVIEKTKKRSGSNTVWKCKCECGNICYVSSQSLINGKTKSCGCLHKSLFSKNLEGKTFGKLKVIEKTNLRDNSGCVIWKCQCECGNNCNVSSTNLTHGRTQSCGCMRIYNTIHQQPTATMKGDINICI